MRYVNVVKLFSLAPAREHPHGLKEEDFSSLFTPDKPVIFNFHGYPWLIHRLTYSRTNHANFHVRGYKENNNAALDLAISTHGMDAPEINHWRWTFGHGSANNSARHHHLS